MTKTPALLAEVQQSLLAQGVAPESTAIVSALRDCHALMSPSEIDSVVGHLHDNMLGFGPLQPLFDQPGLTDVLVNSPTSVFTDSDAGLVRAAVEFESEAHVRALAQRLANQLNSRLDEAHPYFEARTKTGWRVHVVIPPVSGDYTRISVRTPSQKIWSIDELLETNTCSPAQARALSELVEARRTFVVSGATGAGKTTVLSAMLGAVAADERIVVVEDTPELRPAHPHVVHLHARAANIEGAGAVVLTDLVRQSLRMRPDRVVVGEVRGLEVAELLNAFNTGHQGGGTTIHANSAADALARINLLGLMAGLPACAIREQIRIGIEKVIHVARAGGGRRRIVEIATVEELMANGVLGP